MEEHGRRVGKAPYALSLGIRVTWVATLQPLYPRGTAPLGINWLWGWISPWSDANFVTKRNACPSQESNLGRPVGYWVGYSSSSYNTATVIKSRAGIAQSVQRLATGWTIRWSGFDFRGGGSERFSSTWRPDRFWDPHSLLSNGYWGFFPLG
jgi:hypothetical protein